MDENTLNEYERLLTVAQTCETERQRRLRLAAALGEYIVAAGQKAEGWLIDTCHEVYDGVMQEIEVYAGKAAKAREAAWAIEQGVGGCWEGGAS